MNEDREARGQFLGYQCPRPPTPQGCFSWRREDFGGVAWKWGGSGSMWSGFRINELKLHLRLTQGASLTEDMWRQKGYRQALRPEPSPGLQDFEETRDAN